MTAAAPDIYPAVIEISRGAIAHNVAAIRYAVGAGRTIIATIKANAYGHGSAGVARILAECGVGYLAVDTPADARSAGATGKPVLVLNEVPPAVAADLARQGFIPTVTTTAALDAVAAAGPPSPPVFIKVDSGFGRFGVPLADARSFVAEARSRNTITVDGVYTHLPFSDDAGRRWADARLAQFEHLIEVIESDGGPVPVTQATASPGVVAGASDRLNAVAVGHLLFGLDPMKAEFSHRFEAFGLRPALRAIRTLLVKASTAPPGDEAALYLRHGVTRTGVVPVGLSHGYPSPVGGTTATMLFAGRPVPVLRVCLSSTVLDLSRFPDAEPGDEVLLAGPTDGTAISIADVARWRNASLLAALTALGSGLGHRYDD
jgi:alanine racemase